MKVQYSLKELVASFGLIGTGIGLFAHLFVPRDGHVPAPLNNLQFVIWFACGALIGAGLLLPFKRPFIGALLGLAVQIIGWLSMGIIWT